MSTTGSAATTTATAAVAESARTTRSPAGSGAVTTTRRPTSRWRLGKVGHRVLLIAHVLSSVGWFGIAAMVAFLGIATAATDLGSQAAPVLRLTLFVSVPVGLLAALTGIALSVTTRYGLVRYKWVVLKELITVAVIVTDLLVVRAGISQALTEGGPADILFPSIAHTIMLALATVLSMVKPFAKTPYGRRRLA